MHRFILIASGALAALAVLTVSPAAAVQDNQTQSAAKESLAQLDADAAQAKQRIIEIVNQPITHLARTDEAGEFSPGWFHPGATKPDFSKVDIRQTQTFPYKGYRYVTSNLNPSEMFIASELEFNPMTKYFYTDRTLPKRELSEDEMLEVNRLYRIIGRDEQAHQSHLMVMALTLLGVTLGGSVVALVLFPGLRRI
ncbi:MAG TPA: hypothetical protein VGH03_20710 [Caulobacteraceae bacterium]|jgi:hypothetical protein